MAGLSERMYIVTCFSKKTHIKDARQTSQAFKTCEVYNNQKKTSKPPSHYSKLNIGLPKYDYCIKGNTALKANQNAALLMAI
jgi:hypothetical protein